MRRIWTINGRFLTQPVTGVQRYAREIVRALDDHLVAGHPLARDLDVELIVPPGANDAPSLHAIGMREVGRAGGHLWEQTVLPRHVEHGLVSLCNTGPLVVRRHVLCIHDLNTRLCPESYSLRFRLLYRILLPALAREATTVATVSEFSAGELRRYGLCERGKIRVIPDGHEHALRWEARHSAATREAAGPDVIVVIGSSVPHKNVGLILGMARTLESVGLRIAVVGQSDPRVFADHAAARPADNITWLGRLSDDELAALLGDCLCLAFPSLVEGFGLPALEAMAVGCPVVVSDRASLPEICADAALYAPPTDAGLWFDQFVRLRADSRLRIGLAEKARARAAAYSWRQSAELYLQEMARIDGVVVESAG